MVASKRDRSTRWPRPAAGEPEPLQAAGAVVLDEDVAALDDALHDVTAGLAFQVDDDRALVAVDREEVGRVTAPPVRAPDEGRTPAPGPVAVGWLDLYHFGA